LIVNNTLIIITRAIIVPEHIIEEQVTIKDTDIEDVYEKCLLWSKRIGKRYIFDRRNNIQLEEKPSRIIARHEKNILVRICRVQREK